MFIVLALQLLTGVYFRPQTLERGKRRQSGGEKRLRVVDKILKKMVENWETRETKWCSKPTSEFQVVQTREVCWCFSSWTRFRRCWQLLEQPIESLETIWNPWNMENNHQVHDLFRIPLRSCHLLQIGSCSPISCFPLQFSVQLVTSEHVHTFLHSVRLAVRGIVLICYILT